MPMMTLASTGTLEAVDTDVRGVASHERLPMAIHTMMGKERMGVRLLLDRPGESAKAIWRRGKDGGVWCGCTHLRSLAKQWMIAAGQW